MNYSKSNNLFLLRSLLPPNTDLYIGARNKDNGYLLSHLTDEHPFEDFIQMLSDNFNTQGIQQSDFYHFTIKVEAMFSHFTDHIHQLLTQNNNIIFNQLIDFKQQGVFQNFNQYYHRIMIGKASGTVIDTLNMQINELYAYHLNQFKIYPNFNKNEHLNSFYISERSSRISYAQLVAEKFYVVINLLLMSMMCEYYGDKIYFSEQIIFENKLTDIENHILYLINSPKEFSYSEYQNHHYQSEIDRYTLYVAINEPEKLKKLTLIQNSPITAERIGEIMKNSINPSNWHYDRVSIDVNLSKQKRQYFDYLIELLSTVRYIKEMNNKLKLFAQSGSSHDDMEASTHFDIWLKVPQNHSPTPNHLHQ
ncbi:hypothetical protein NQ807_11960 [Acinetobacter baumannii]|nr:hypothetical protein [Acinetobacter baumannii]